MPPLPISSFPDELLESIFSFLSAPPPSSLLSRQEPSLQLTSSAGSLPQDLKSISLTSRRWRRIVLPELFACARVRLEGVQLGSEAGQLSWPARFEAALEEFLRFVRAHALAARVRSFVLLSGRTAPTTSGSGQQRGVRFPHLQEGESGGDGGGDGRWRAAAEFWHRLFSELDPARVAVVAPPADLACWTSCAVDMLGEWAFGDMEFHILELSVQPEHSDTGRRAGSLSSPFAPALPDLDFSSLCFLPEKYPGIAPSSLLTLRPWTHLALNEGSFLRAYSTYEYFERGPPSLFFSIRHWIAAEGFPSLRSFTYTALLPFAQHLDFRALLPQLLELDVQLAPAPGSQVLGNRARVGKAQLEDCWQELFAGYATVTRHFRSAQITPDGFPPLRRFVCRDMWNPELSSDLDYQFVPLCLPVWAEVEPGVFERQQDGPAPVFDM